MSGVNVLYAVSRLPEWIQMAKELASRLEWRPAYWVTRPACHTCVAETFPGVIAHPIFNLNRGLAPDGLPTLRAGPLSQRELDLGQEFELIAMDLMDRIDLGRSFSYQERQRLFHRLLMHWIESCRQHDLQIAVFNAPPHSIGEYVAYAAFRILGLETRIFRPTPVNGLHIVCDRVDALPNKLRRCYEQQLCESQPHLSRQVQAGLDQLRSASSDYRPWYAERASKREKDRALLRQRAEHALESGAATPEVSRVNSRADSGAAENPMQSHGAWPGNVLNRKRRPHHDQPHEQALKRPGHAISAPAMLKWEYITYRDLALVQKVALEGRYRELTSQSPTADNYIYFAMHYQPERTTCPDGGRFGNQYLAISLIASALPEGWKLFVKEHPNQFSFHGRGELCRWREYYDDIVRLPNVHLVPLDVPGLDLIDGARVVATITGATGWEALNRGKPVICFGAAWYGFCSGAFVVRTTDDVHRALSAIEAGKTPSTHDVDAYAAALEATGQAVYTNPSLAREGGLRDTLASRLTGLLVTFEQERLAAAN